MLRNLSETFPATSILSSVPTTHGSCQMNRTNVNSYSQDSKTQGSIEEEAKLASER